MFCFFELVILTWKVNVWNDLFIKDVIWFYFEYRYRVIKFLEEENYWMVLVYKRTNRKTHLDKMIIPWMSLNILGNNKWPSYRLCYNIRKITKRRYFLSSFIMIIFSILNVFAKTLNDKLYYLLLILISKWAIIFNLH